MPISVQQSSGAPSATQPDGSSANPLASSSAPLPTGAAAITATSGVITAGTIAAATLAAATGKTTYITGFDILTFGQTTTSIATITVAGLLGGTLSYLIQVPTGAAVVAIPYPFSIRYAPAMPGSAANTAIVVTLPAATGNTNAVVNAYGFQI